jgi:cell wall-associated NlpC family hydrolase
MPAKTLVALALALLLAACASTPRSPAGISPPVPVVPVPDSVAATAATTALSLVGTPYRYGGDTLAGFDCSGLVYFAYLQAGLKVPRSSEQQFLAAAPVPIGEALRGDLLFFRSDGKVSHVAIYLDDGRFVHAPSTGKTVVLGSLDSSYYRSHFAGAGRVVHN